MNQLKSTTTSRLYFFDFVRNVAMLAVVVFHAVAAYSTVTPHWYSHDGSSVVADIVRKVFDPVMMPNAKLWSRLKPLPLIICQL